MQKGKRITSLLLASLIAVSASAVAVPPVSAAESGIASQASVESNFKYDVLDDGTAEITDYTGNAANLVIPSEIDGHTVTSIGGRVFEDCVSLKSVTIPNSVKTIGAGAFFNCASLRSLTIPNSVSEIKSTAFSSCTSLESITIPNGVTEIEDWVFSGCESLKNVIIPDSVVEIKDYAFNCCDSLESITIPDSVTNIGGCAFQQCKSLKSVTLPNCITKIEGGTFAYCTSLKTIKIPSSVTEIDDDYFFGGAFEGCTSLKNILIPSSVTKIEYNAFNKCNPDVTFFGTKGSVAETYANDNDINFVEDKNITTDGFVYSEFSDETISITGYIGNATNLVIPSTINGKSVTEIEILAFESCTSIESVTLPNSVTKVADAAFWGCTSLKSITIPNGVTAIEDSEFWGCTSLTNITIPNSVTRIGPQAFGGCVSLKSITIPSSVTLIGGNVFEGCTGLTSITIPNSVKSISDWTFYDCENLKSITIPNSVKSIGERAFYCCYSLTSIIIPDSVTSIGENVFEYCSDLTIYGKKGSAAETYAKNNGIKFVAQAQSISTAKVSLAKTSAIYTGKAITPAVTVKNGNTTLKNGTDYTVSYKNNTNIGTATVTVTGKGNYTGTKTATFKIVAPTVANVKSLKAAQSTSAVKLSWGKVSGATNYDVYQKIGGKWKKVATTKSTSYTVKKLKAGTVYNFAVRANKVVGKKTFNGAFTFITTATKPANIKSLKATQSTSAVKLSWSKVSGATGYDVYQKVSGKWKKIATTKSTSYTVKKLKAGTVYNFAVRANKTVGNKTFNGAFAFITTATKPANVKSLKAAQSTSAVKLSWGKVSGATNYDVYQKIGGKWKKIATTKSTSYTVKKLKAGTVYNFAVRANKVVGKTTYNGAFTFITTATKTATPAMSVKAAGSKKATVTWKKVSGATGYQIYMSTKKTSGYKKVATVSAKKTAKYTKTNLKKGKTYYVRVRTYKVVGKAKIYSGYQTKAVKIK